MSSPGDSCPTASGATDCTRPSRPRKGHSQPPKDTYARMSFQRFFRNYRKLSGMTGTATEAVREFWQIYHLPVVVIPTNRPCIRVKYPDRVFATEQAKWDAIIEEIQTTHRQGRPILIGTRSVRSSEHLSDLLVNVGLEHQVLNAVRHAEEAQIVAAGRAGRKNHRRHEYGRSRDRHQARTRHRRQGRPVRDRHRAPRGRSNRPPALRSRSQARRPRLGCRDRLAPG